MHNREGYSLRLDPWDVDYGSQVPVDPPEMLDAGDRVDTTVEVAGPFVPIAPREAPMPPTMVFVDGVRRIDARVLVERTGAPEPHEDFREGWSHGLFGSFAVGSAVVTSSGRASWGASQVGRILATGGGLAWGEVVSLSSGTAYRPVAAAGTDPDAPLRAFQAEMRSAEATVARTAAPGGALIVVDGPLTFDSPTGAPVLGFVKRIHELYVGREARVLRRLALHERSPLFALRASNRFARLSWFVRIGTPRRGESELTGLVRVEVSERVGVEEARRLADLSAHVLPRLVPTRARDPRAPQNLVPIGALEHHLRRSLGDGRLTRRHIQTLLSGGIAA